MSAELTDVDTTIDLVKTQLSSLSALVTAEGYALAASQAEQELGWSYPVTNPTKAFWMVQRTVRHAINILRIASANKFKYKLVNLQQRFEHFQKMVETMDADYIAAISSDVALFAGVDSFRLFGTKVDAGFCYDIVGKDLTYDSDKLVNFTPLETD
jgi:hypothetical protein